MIALRSVVRVALRAFAAVILLSIVAPGVAPVVYAQQSAHGNAALVRELSRTTTSVTLEIIPVAPSFDTTKQGIALVPAVQSVRNGDSFAPIAITIRASAKASVRVERIERGLIHLAPQFYVRAVSIVDRTRVKTRATPTPHLGIGTAQFRYLGKARAVSIGALTVGALDYDASSRTLSYASKIVVTITDPAGFNDGVDLTNIREAYLAPASVFRSRLAAQQTAGKSIKPMAAGDVDQTPRIRADDGYVYRFYVNRDGIYHLTYDDIKTHFGIDPGTIDMTTLRIIGQGQQVPIYVFDHQDGHFDPNDYFEFFGEEKKLNYNSKYGDEYYDPFTHYNVYYVVWGTKYSALPVGGVKRLVEESGEIRESDRSKFTDLRTSSFRSRLHYEHDTYHQDLENTDLNDLSSLRDHSFTAEVFTAQSVVMDTITPYPDVENGKPFTLRVAFHGVSHFDPGEVDTHGNPVKDVPNENQADVSVNGTHLLLGIWDSQVMKFLSTDTVSQRLLQSPPPPGLLKTIISDDLVTRLSFPLEVRVESKLVSDVQYCQFDVNWFDLDYDRLYSAYQDQIQFSIPQSRPTGLYQFTLSNFTRSDISIYRKGVSKISNMFIDAGGPNQNGIKAIFQLNVASDADQFFAVTESQKLKPARYQRDVWTDLRDRNNRASYLVITDKSHLAKDATGQVTNGTLVRLVQEHEQREGVSGMVVDVANIYDAFSFGCRTPQAIKDFLTYAYNNWQDPPRVVLLVGVTHLGSDDTLALAPPDQVPTFYFQSYGFGSTSTDTWFSLLDGDDLIPDIILGRLPSTTTDQDLQYVNKVLRFDQDPYSPGVWKDRALFVSGEHLNGNDFYGEIGYLVATALPKNVGVERVGLDLDLPYYGTDKDLVAAINGGISYMQFMGHGGLGVWADPIPGTGRSLFLADDASRLTNDTRLPFIASLTCFTGAFDGSTQNALLPALLLAPHGGAIGALGASSFGFREEDVHLAGALMVRMFDTMPASYGARVTAGKIDYFVSNDPFGNVVDPTLMLSYLYLGDPLVSPFLPDQHVSVTLSTRVAQPGSSVTITGATSLKTGLARIELMGDGNEPFVPPHVLDRVSIVNGAFTATDALPATITFAAGAYHVVVYQDDHSVWGRTTSDLSFSSARVTQVELNPHPVDVGTNLTLSAAVQSPSGVQTVWGVIHYYITDAAGNRVEARPMDSVAMTLSGDRYVTPPIPGSNLLRSMVVSGRVVLYPTTGAPVTSDSVKLTVGASADPAAFRDALHHTMTGRYRTTSAGLVWQATAYNWGSDDATNVNVSLRDTTSKQVLASSTVPAIVSRSSTLVQLQPDASSLDTGGFVFFVTPAAGTSPFALRDSTLANDTSYVLQILRGAAGYLQTQGSTLTGGHQIVPFDSGMLALELLPGAEANIASDVIRVSRLTQLPVLQQYASQQPDIHFVSLKSHRGRAVAAYRIVSDSLGAIPLAQNATISIRIDPNDTTIAPHLANLFIYRQDDRSKQWTILPTTRTNDVLTASAPNLGNFAVAYHSDKKPPLVDMTIEGQVFVSGGDVPDRPHVTAVLQDANGIDITPGKTIVKVDGRALSPSQFAMLDSLRTPTTASLHFEPTLTDGTHSLSVQTTDNNGNQSAEQKLDVVVSHDFVIRTLGSYPNPFSVQMFLAYEIRGIPFAESVQLRIYTVSGRLIRTLQFPSDDPNQTFGFLKGGTGVPTSLGYHEVWWDGHDDGGSDVANGAYFYKLLVKSPNDEKDLTGKFARVR